MKKLDLL